MSAAPAPLELVDARTLEILARRRSSTVPHRRGWLVRRALLAADVVALIVAFTVVETAFGQAGGRAGSLKEYGVFFLSLPAWVVVAKLYGLYDRDEERNDHTTAEDIVDVFHLVTVGVWLLFGFAALTHLSTPDVRKFFAFWAAGIVLVALGRGAARIYCRRQISYVQNTLILGADDVAQTVAHKFLKHPEYGINLVGFVDESVTPIELSGELGHVAVLGQLEDVPELVMLLDVERVVISFPEEPTDKMLRLIRELTALNVQVDFIPRFHEVMGSSADVHSVEGLSLISLRPPQLARSSALIKRAVDLVGAALALILFAPLLAAAAVAIKLDSPGPVFFRQSRAGRGGKTFSIFKFRTMAADADERRYDLAHLNTHLLTDPRMFKVPDDPRVTRVGKVLRRYSIDELPQLLNVLGGEMSLVGPRPLSLDEHLHVTDWAERRLALRPGITGLWQVLGRAEIPFGEMVRLDYLYVTSWSLFLDLRLILRTLPVVFRAQRAT